MPLKNSFLTRVQMGDINPPDSTVALPDGVPGREAQLVLGALARLKRGRFGRLVVSVSDGRVVDIELTVRVDREELKNS